MKSGVDTWLNDISKGRCKVNLNLLILSSKGRLELNHFCTNGKSKKLIDSRSCGFHWLMNLQKKYPSKCGGFNVSRKKDLFALMRHETSTNQNRSLKPSENFPSASFGFQIICHCCLARSGNVDVCEVWLWFHTSMPPNQLSFLHVVTEYIPRNVKSNIANLVVVLSPSPDLSGQPER
jgi:hypothetical protein